jgi:phenylalanyl-tRNA synthetase alpha chain
MEQDLSRLKDEAIKALEAITSASDLEPFRVKYLGRKGGLLTGIMRRLADVPKEDKTEFKGVVYPVEKCSKIHK